MDRSGIRGASPHSASPPSGYGFIRANNSKEVDARDIGAPSPARLPTAISGEDAPSRTPPAARPGRHQRHEDTEAHGLQDFLRDLDLLGAVAAGLGRERDPNRVADALLQQDAQGGRGRDHAFRTHAGLGEAEMDRIVGAPGE